MHARTNVTTKLTHHAFAKSAADFRKYVIYRESGDGTTPSVPRKAKSAEAEASGAPVVQLRLSEFGDRLVAEHFDARLALLAKRGFDGSSTSAQAEERRVSWLLDFLHASWVHLPAGPLGYWSAAVRLFCPLIHT